MSAKSVGKWTKPGFLNKKPVNFGINRKGYSNGPLTLNVQEANMRWEDGSWQNLNLDEPPKNAYPTIEEIKRIREENDKFRVECEILLHMLTQSELKKAKNKRALSDKKQKILVLLEQVRQKQNRPDD